MVRLSDVFVAPVYGSYTSLNNLENDALVSSGILAQSDLFDAIAAGGAKSGTIPFWRDLNRNDEPNYSNDDPADLAVPLKIGTGTMSYRKSYLNQSYGSMDLVKELAADDPLAIIKSRFDNYWIGRRQRRLIATVQGIIADNIANDGGDMVVDVSAAAVDVNPNAQKWSKEAYIDGAYTMGDQVGNLSAMIVHSQVAKRMAKTDAYQVVRDTEGKIIFRQYGDEILLVDDNMPKSGTGANTVYDSYIFGAGAFGFAGVEGHAVAAGEGVPSDGVWTERTEQAGNGGGMEVIGERKTQILHPFGFTWVEGTLAEFSPTDADLRLAAHWDRVVERKYVPIAVVRTKV